MSSTDLWDTLSANYDRFVNWEQRLDREMPFLESHLASHGARRVLDVACGTGHHAIAFAKRGYEVVGTDISAGMVRRARQNAKSAGAAASFHQAGFGHLREAVKKPFDALLCLGNSLPSVLSEEALDVALADMAGVLAPGGLIVIQNLNYDRVWPQRERFMPLQTYQQGEEEWLFFRFVDFHQETLTFNMVVLHRNGEIWNYDAESTELRPLLNKDLNRLLERSGLTNVDFYGDYDQNPYQEETSGDLIVVARKG
jgi:ubiquinone/menaquinone biosynthesis C-methylase UbiE